VRVEDVVEIENGIEVVVAWRFNGHAPRGSCVTKRCLLCAERVALSLTNAERVTSGIPVYCRDQCWPNVKARTVAEAPELAATAAGLSKP